MRPFRASVWCCALAVVAASAGSTRAAWNNVFEACCWNCQSGATANYPPADPCNTCQPQCTTHYVQRSYYQPVTTYTQRTYYEPVTTYRTSYYYEPVTSYHYSCYYDPCTCHYQQVATPSTCYKLRSQCCPVTSYMQRCAMQPVTSYQQAFYYEPVTSCCQTTVGAPVLAPPAGAAITPAVPTAPPQVVAPPQVSEPAAAPPANLPPYTPPNVSDGGNTPTSQSNRFDRNPNPGPAMPKAFDQSSQQPRLGSPRPDQPAPAQTPEPPPAVRIDRIASHSGASVEGRVVKSSDRTPHAGAKLLFVSADRQGAQESVTADGEGRFRTSLASGGWLVYVQDADGRPIFHEKVDVRDDAPQTMTLVSRQR